MKIYITNYSNKKLKGTEKRYSYVHYYHDCKKLNADFIEEDLRLPNSGIREMEIKKEILFSVLHKMGYFGICKECESRSFIQEHDNHSVIDNESKIKD